MPIHDDLGSRMKAYYEQIPKTKLMRRCPVVIRLDGKAFHSFTRGFQRPFDEVLIRSMQDTAKYLCENIQGCVLSYQQSDEISLLLVDYKNLNSSAWFDYEVQKMCSIAASMATMKFNRDFKNYVDAFEAENLEHLYSRTTNEAIEKLYSSYCTAKNKGAMFDARVFNIPKEEVTNYFYWRQLDAMRNSVQMVGQANFSNTELHEKTCDMIKNMLLTQKNIDWNELPNYQQRGSCCIKTGTTITCASMVDNEVKTKTIERPHWIVDKNIPIFKGPGREYIDNLVFVGE